MVKNIAFFILFFLIIFSGFFVVTSKNLFKAALFLALCLFGVSGIYILLDAEFLAATQILIYIGGVVILILLAIVLSEGITGEKEETYNDQRYLASFGVAIFFMLIVKIIGDFSFVFKYKPILPSQQNTQEIGTLLLLKYILPFEIVSVLLLIALIGAIVFVKRNLNKE